MESDVSERFSVKDPIDVRSKDYGWWISALVADGDNILAECESRDDAIMIVEALNAHFGKSAIGK